ncbi:CPBP family intramembrane glutamic endopeptidase [Streptantibioticus cattleyicolor]|uniref:Abortive infection protein n=1 Tax=Streptantibioticus cattleyicolor (strain ATCC 35852 / DSM 46488 / JCM 4925 / NBRC 14057 / NRRL 8057) TaxID=1003195 RepID=F8JJP5_STREN|nr:CPBP family intramembrane glutamic endopeptidase [Streptantibioticus cattleyicolor]AEW99907.1 Abortive infection protein [Streptantibioticus cattleyicolor NRRL 8057 = DSM 46488]CCB71059.1 putative transmembrane protein [Streptantibioticus cattleyicolor NRRL 8057 = DSM 46488]
MKLVWQILAVVVVGAVGGRSVTAVRDDPWLSLLLGAVAVVLSVVVYRWVVGRTERRPVAELAREGASGSLLRGLVIGVAMFGCVIANISFLGDYEVHGLGSPTGAIGLVGFMAGAAVSEELMFRGLLFRLVERGLGTYIALALSGVVFGAVHLLNKDATVLGAIAIALEAGGMLAAAYAATRSLWLPIGLHFGWNFAESGIFGTEVSGNGDVHGLLDASTSGPRLISGGEFGPEASVYAMLFGALLTVAFLWLARRRGHIVPRQRAGRVDALATLAR